MTRAIMFFIVTLTVLLVSQNNAFELPDGGKIWALLVASSSGYGNYRHQANVCHAYQILHSNGIPDENIIVMMEDDIAYNKENPNKGVIINRPGGPNVYSGVLKDYTGGTVTPKNFLKILKGDEEGMRNIGSGRVIKSGPNDHVFVYFVDHGAPGLVAFSHGILYGSDLIKTLEDMANEKKFGKLVFYLEACESGSMFDGLLPNNLNIFALTAANSHEPSYACCYDGNLHIFVGDVFSGNWMEDTEKENLQTEDINQQYEVVKNKTSTSHVQKFGDPSIETLHVSEFLGVKMTNGFSNYSLPPVRDVVTNRNVPLAHLEKKMEAAKDLSEKQYYSHLIHNMLKHRRHLEQVVYDILMLATNQSEAIVEELKDARYTLKRNDYPCYKKLVSSFSEKCFKVSENPHSMGQLYMFANICGRSDISEDYVVTAIEEICTSKQLIVGVY